MTDHFARLAEDHRLVDRRCRSPEGLHERYHYTPDMVFRSAFGRWWDGLHGRSREVGPLLTEPQCLGATRRGGPQHPRYVPADAVPVTRTPESSPPA